MENSPALLQPRLNANQLKLLGCLFMLIDHIGYLLLPGALWLRCLGRLSFPLFAFMLANGFFHTRSRGKYLLRLCAFALLFQPVYAACMANGRWNIFATLALGLLALTLCDACARRGFAWLGLLCAAALAAAAELLRLEYGWYGAGMIVSAYLFFSDIRRLALSWLLLNLAVLLPVSALSAIQVYSLLALALIASYNRQRGGGGRWFFYLFYCLHIPLLYWIGSL